MRIISIPASILMLWLAGTGAAAAADDAAGNSMDLRELITMAGGKFRKQFIVDPEVRGSVNLGTFSSDSLTYHAFLQVLNVNGFLAVPSGDGVTIIAEDRVARVTSPVVNAEDLRGDDAEVVTVLIPMEGDARQIAPIMRSLIPRWASITTQPDQKSILVVDRVANVKRIMALVRTQSTSPPVSGSGN